MRDYGHTPDDEDRGDLEYMRRREDEMLADDAAKTNLTDALKALNAAAYAAIRAGRDTTLFPDLDRRALRQICAMTDKLVDEQ